MLQIKRNIKLRCVIKKKKIDKITKIKMNFCLRGNASDSYHI